MGWILRLDAPADTEPTVSRLWDLGTNGVAEIASPSGIELVAGFGSKEGADLARALLGGAVERVDDEWTNAEPTLVEVGNTRLAIESGQAFGHGGHPTTAQVLAALPRLVRGHPDEHVLDVGTGTGVLALAAAALGAGDVTAFDHDPAAVEVARSNAVRNGLDVSFSIEQPVVGTNEFDLVLMNVPIGVHQELGPGMAGRLGSDGALVSAGTTSSQWAALRSAYAALAPVERSIADDWECVIWRPAGRGSQ